MSGQRRQVRRTDGDERLEGRGVTATVERPGTNLHDHLLSLQRDYGNKAVTAVVQRRERPQSTDAPGRKKKAPPKKAATPDYAPKEPNPKFSSWSTADLAARAAQELDSGVKNSWYFAAELYEEYWFRTKGRDAALMVSRAYRKIGDPARVEFWTAVATGSIKPGEKKSTEDWADKEF